MSSRFFTSDCKYLLVSSFHFVAAVTVVVIRFIGVDGVVALMFCISCY